MPSILVDHSPQVQHHPDQFKHLPPNRPQHSPKTAYHHGFSGSAYSGSSMDDLEKFALKEKNRVYSNNRRARDRGQVGNLKLTEWLLILMRWEFKCAYCGMTYQTMDHVIPLGCGGNTTKLNVVTPGGMVKLTNYEAKVLYILLSNAGRFVSPQFISRRIWNDDAKVKTLKVLIHRIRRKAEKDPTNPVYIISERGVGYQFAIRH